MRRNADRTPRNRPLGPIILTACFVAATAVRAPEARAQWIVSDPGVLGNAIIEYAEQAKRWVETAQHYKDTIQHYAGQVAFWKEQLVQLKGLELKLFKLENQFRTIPEGDGVAETCPGAASGIGDITSVLQSLIPDMNGDIVKQQAQVCEAIVRTKNRKYNMTVRYFKFLSSSTKQLEEVHSDRLSKVSQSMANLSSILTDTERYSSNIETARKQWETDVAQQDSVIAMLQHRQALLARRAMYGKPQDALGTLVNTVVLRAALSH